MAAAKQPMHIRPPAVPVAPPAPSTPSLARDYHLLQGDQGPLLLAVDGSRLYELDADTARELEHALAAPRPDPQFRAAMDRAFGKPRTRIDGTPLTAPPLRSLSLNVAQTCNLACGYCYADEGRFGGRARMMDQATARTAVDRLIAESEPDCDLIIGFMGGEPLLNSALIHATTAYAAEQCARHRRRARFSLTTNATLVSEADARLFREHRFSVAVSVDGAGPVNDRTRPTRRGGGSYAAMRRGLDRILAHGGPGHVSARITVVPESRNLLATLRHVIGLGVGDAGFAPVQVSPQPHYQFDGPDFDAFLTEMLVCGEYARDELLAGRRFPFSNFETALNEIHRGSHRPYPCGAGAAYLSVGAEGDLYACHRLIDQSDWHMGDIHSGSDRHARQALLDRKHVDLQQPCRDCWARYLCGGGCYHEVARRGRRHCDYVRGWLDFCLRAYARLCVARPDYFLDPETYFEPTGSRP